MYSTEPKVGAGSDYYIYHPSALAQKIYLYPIIVGQFHYESGYHLKRSQLESFLLMYIISGSCMVVRPERTLRAGPDSFVLLNCYEPHEYYFTEETESLWMHFDGPLAQNYYELISQGRGHVLTLKNSYPSAHAMRRILRLFRERTNFTEIRMSNSITEILGGLLGMNVTAEAATRDTAIERTLAYISEHFSENLSLEQLAENASMSPFHFTRVFALETGFTPHQYLIATRINSAKFLLQSSEKTSIKEIAFLSGFNSESSFCATFRKREKMTPGEYRSRVLG